MAITPNLPNYNSRQLTPNADSAEGIELTAKKSHAHCISTIVQLKEGENIRITSVEGIPEDKLSIVTRIINFIDSLLKQETFVLLPIATQHLKTNLKIQPDKQAFVYVKVEELADTLGITAKEVRKRYGEKVGIKKEALLPLSRGLDEFYAEHFQNNINEFQANLREAKQTLSTKKTSLQAKQQTHKALQKQLDTERENIKNDAAYEKIKHDPNKRAEFLMAWSDTHLALGETFKSQAQPLEAEMAALESEIAAAEQKLKQFPIDFLNSNNALIDTETQIKAAIAQAEPAEQAALNDSQSKRLQKLQEARQAFISSQLDSQAEPVSYRELPQVKTLEHLALAGNLGLAKMLNKDPNEPTKILATESERLNQTISSFFEKIQNLYDHEKERLIEDFFKQQFESENLLLKLLLENPHLDANNQLKELQDKRLLLTIGWLVAINPHAVHKKYANLRYTFLQRTIDRFKANPHCALISDKYFQAFEHAKISKLGDEIDKIREGIGSIYNLTAIFSEELTRSYEREFSKSFSKADIEYLTQYQQDSNIFRRRVIDTFVKQVDKLLNGEELRTEDCQKFERYDSFKVRGLMNRLK